MASKHLILIESQFFVTGFQVCRYAKELGYEVTLIARDLSLYLEGVPLKEHPLGEADYHIETETNDAAELIAFLEEYAKERPFHGIATFSDYYVEVTAQAAAHFGLPGSSPAAVEIAKNKDRSRRCLDEHHVPQAAFVVVQTEQEAIPAAERIGYPCVVKPTAENGSHGVMCVQNQQELEVAFREVHAIKRNDRGQEREGLVLIEEFMRGEEISVETFSLAGDCHVFGITSKGLTGFPYFVEVDFCFPYRLGDEQESQIEDVVRQALSAIGYDNGPCHTEIKLTAEGPKIVEINPRVAGWYVTTMVDETLGVHPMKETIKMAMGDPVSLLSDGEKMQGAAYGAIAADSTGIVERVDGIEEVKRIAGFAILDLHVQAGDRVRRAEQNYDTIGFLYTRGDDAAQAMTRLQEARSRLQVVVRAEEGASE